MEIPPGNHLKGNHNSVYNNKDDRNHDNDNYNGNCDTYANNDNDEN